MLQVIYCGILTLLIVGTAVNYHGIFMITLACTIKLFTAVFLPYGNKLVCFRKSVTFNIIRFAIKAGAYQCVAPYGNQP